MHKVKICKNCDGTGWVENPKLEICPVCNYSSGKIWNISHQQRINFIKKLIICKKQLGINRQVHRDEYNDWRKKQ